LDVHLITHWAAAEPGTACFSPQFESLITPTSITRFPAARAVEAKVRRQYPARKSLRSIDFLSIVLNTSSRLTGHRRGGK
jgi:hypothetical protein